MPPLEGCVCSQLNGTTIYDSLDNLSYHILNYWVCTLYSSSSPSQMALILAFLFVQTCSLTLEQVSYISHFRCIPQYQTLRKGVMYYWIHALFSYVRPIQRKNMWARVAVCPIMYWWFPWAYLTCILECKVMITHASRFFFFFEKDNYFDIQNLLNLYQKYNYRSNQSIN